MSVPRSADRGVAERRNTPTLFRRNAGTFRRNTSHDLGSH